MPQVWYDAFRAAIRPLPRKVDATRLRKGEDPPVQEPDRSLEVEKLDIDQWFLVGKRLCTKKPMYPGSPVMETSYWLTDAQLHGLFAAISINNPLSLREEKIISFANFVCVI